MPYHTVTQPKVSLLRPAQGVGVQPPNFCGDTTVVGSYFYHTGTLEAYPQQVREVLYIAATLCSSYTL